MSQSADNPYLTVNTETSQVLNAETTHLDLSPQDLVEVIKYEYGRTMPCCNLVQIPKESLQGRYRFLGVELEVNVVGVLAQLATKQCENNPDHTCVCASIFLKPLRDGPGYRSLADSFSPSQENCGYYGVPLSNTENT